MTLGYIISWYWDSGIGVGIGVLGKGNKCGKVLGRKTSETRVLLITWDKFSWGLLGIGGHG